MTYEWFEDLGDKGLRPYVATSRHQLPSLNLAAAGEGVLTFCLEDGAALSFHGAYSRANALAFGARNLTMPGWVYIDCVLMQTAVVGFAAGRDNVPSGLMEELGSAAEDLDWVPVSGQTASPAIDGKTLVGFSLFSLRSYWPELPPLGLPTKGLALEVYNARRFDRFLGITQYDNPALAMHGRFGRAVEIVAPRVPLHAQGDMSLVYGMKIDFDPARLDEVPDVTAAPDFWMEAGEAAGIARLEEGIAKGERYFILPPFQVREGQSLMLPITEGLPA